MTPLDQVISAAFSSLGRQEDINKVYLSLLQTLLYVPIQKTTPDNSNSDHFAPLFANIEENYFILAFDTPERLAAWAGEHYQSIQQTQISGHDLIMNAPKQVYLCLNIGTEWYKEFSPEEVDRLRTIATRIAALTPPSPQDNHTQS